MKRVIVLLIVGTVLSGVAAVYAASAAKSRAQTQPALVQTPNP